MSYKVTVERNTLRFAAAHFATFEGQCEPLHGHNYAVMIEVEGGLTEDGWVIDFGLVKSIARGLCQQLDHKFILQRDSKALEIEESDGNWKIRFLDRGWVFPTSDVVPLSIENTMSEQLARWFAERLRDAFAERGATNVTSIAVGIEEMPGQAGWHTLETS